MKAAACRGVSRSVARLLVLAAAAACVGVYVLVVADRQAAARRQAAAAAGGLRVAAPRRDAAGGGASPPQQPAQVAAAASGGAHWIPQGATAKALHGRLGFKADGSPGWAINPMPDRPETLEEKQAAHNPNCFNLRRSDSLPLDRDVPDVRADQCKTIVYPELLPTTSVVFVFFNEPLSPLFRSIHSVLNRTPPRLLHEIVLVDDGSTAPWLGAELEAYLRLLPPKIKLVRMPERLGLMAARTRGAEAATGDTISFLDSHIEVNTMWLEPLLARIKEDRHHVVMPIIDSIDPDLFDYHKGGLDILGFSWGLGQKGISRARKTVEPMPSPIMAGGLFTIHRETFFELGGYDPEMRLYGGEEMEISFRLWQCHCTLECIPCSHVGHIFRTDRYHKGQVYPVPMEVIVKNKLRAAEVWMDEFKDIVKRVMPPLPPQMSLGPLEYMLDIRKRLKCKPFKWYLETVYPEMFVPNQKSMVRAVGEIKNPATNGCVDTLGAKMQGQDVGVYPCHGKHGTQELILTRQNEIRVAAMDYDKCLDRAGEFSVKIWSCHGGGGNQHWAYDEKTGHLTDLGGHQCLEAQRKPSPLSPLTLAVASCTPERPELKWQFSELMND